MIQIKRTVPDANPIFSMHLVSSSSSTSSDNEINFMIVIIMIMIITIIHNSDYTIRLCDHDIPEPHNLLT